MPVTALALAALGGTEILAPLTKQLEEALGMLSATAAGAGDVDQAGAAPAAPAIPSDPQSADDLPSAVSRQSGNGAPGQAGPMASLDAGLAGIARNPAWMATDMVGRSRPVVRFDEFVRVSDAASDVSRRFPEAAHAVPGSAPVAAISGAPAGAGDSLDATSRRGAAATIDGARPAAAVAPVSLFAAIATARLLAHDDPMVAAPDGVVAMAPPRWPVVARSGAPLRQDGTYAWSGGPDPSFIESRAETERATRGQSPASGRSLEGLSIEGDVLLDGAAVGRWMSRTLSSSLRRSAASGTGVDGRRDLLLPGISTGASP